MCRENKKDPALRRPSVPVKGELDSVHLKHTCCVGLSLIRRCDVVNTILTVAVSPRQAMQTSNPHMKRCATHLEFSHNSHRSDSVELHRLDFSPQVEGRYLHGRSRGPQIWFLSPVESPL